MNLSRPIPLLASASILALALLPATMEAESPGVRRTLVVGSSFDDAPYAYLSDDGKPTGFDVAMIRAVAHAAGMDLDFETSGPTQERASDVVLGAYYSDSEQPGIAAYCEAHTIRDHAVFVRDESLYRNLRDLAGRALVAPGDCKALPWLESHGFGPGLVRTDSLGEAFQLLEGGHYEALICDRYQGLDALDSAGLENLRLLPDSVVPLQYGFALAQDDPSLASALNAGLTVVRETGQAERLRAEWLARLDPEPGRISLGGAYTVLLWLVIPGVLLCIGATINTLGFRKRAAARITALEQELEESRQAFTDLVRERARQRYVINQLSTVSLVDQIVEASRH